MYSIGLDSSMDTAIGQTKGGIELTNCQVQDLQQNILDLEAGKERFTFSNGTEYKGPSSENRRSKNGRSCCQVGWLAEPA